MAEPRLRHNIIALGMMQIANYVFPLITLPYLTLTLGVESFGAVAFVQVLATYFSVLTDYGLAWGGTIDISKCRQNKQQVSKIFVVTWAAQWLLAIVASLFFYVVCDLFLSERVSDAFVFSGVFLVMSSVFVPIWLLQGLELMKMSAIVQVVSRFVTLPLTFLLVRESNDAALVPFIMGFGPFFAGVYLLIYVLRKKRVQFVAFTVRDVLNRLRGGFSMFLSKLSMIGYGNYPSLMIGLMGGHSALGVYSLSDKARGAAQAGLWPISQALFPRMSHLFSSDVVEAKRLLRRSLVFMALVGVLIALVLNVFAGFVIKILGGNEFEGSVALLKWMCVLPLISSINGVLGVQVMLPNRMNIEMTLVYISAAVLGAMALYASYVQLGIVGAIQIMIVCEIYVACLMFAILKVRKIL